MTASAVPLQWVDEAAQAFWLLGSPKRLRIVLTLLKEELSVGALVSRTGLRQSTVSQHLTKLRQAGAVVVTRRDKQRFYRLGDLRIIQLLACMEAVGWGGAR